MTPDLGNAIFEAGGAILLWLNVRALLKDKQLRGVVLLPTLWYQTWGAWNLWYYHAIGQHLSWYAGFGVFAANSVWVGLALYFRFRKPRSVEPPRLCKLRCPGGSEAGSCPCAAPIDCPHGPAVPR